MSRVSHLVLEHQWNCTRPWRPPCMTFWMASCSSKAKSITQKRRVTGEHEHQAKWPGQAEAGPRKHAARSIPMRTPVKWGGLLPAQLHALDKMCKAGVMHYALRCSARCKLTRRFGTSACEPGCRRAQSARLVSEFACAGG